MQNQPENQKQTCNPHKIKLKTPQQESTQINKTCKKQNKAKPKYP